MLREKLNPKLLLVGGDHCKPAVDSKQRKGFGRETLSGSKAQGNTKEGCAAAHAEHGDHRARVWQRHQSSQRPRGNCVRLCISRLRGRMQEVRASMNTPAGSAVEMIAWL